MSQKKDKLCFMRQHLISAPEISSGSIRLVSCPTTSGNGGMIENLDSWSNTRLSRDFSGLIFNLVETRIRSRIWSAFERVIPANGFCSTRNQDRFCLIGSLEVNSQYSNQSAEECFSVHTCWNEATSYLVSSGPLNHSMRACQGSITWRITAGY